MAAVAVALALVVGLLAVLVIGLLRSHAEILRALHDLGVNLEDGAPADAAARAPRASRRPPMRTAEGVAAPRAEGAHLGPAADLDGELPGGGIARVAVTGVEHRTLLAFLSTGCGTCGTFWEAFQDPDNRRLPGGDARIVIVTNGREAESAAEVERLAPVGIVTVMSSDAWDDYEVPVAPYFILVDGPRGAVVGEGAGASWSQVSELLGRAAADADLSSGATPPPAPEKRLSRHGQDRAEWVDEELRHAGIEPGDPSLYPAVHPDHEQLR